MSTSVNNGLPPDLSLRSRSVAVVAWSGFLAAAIGTMVCFALLDPDTVASGLVPDWWTDRLTVYAVGFFFFFFVVFSEAAMRVYLLRSEYRR